MAGRVKASAPKREEDEGDHRAGGEDGLLVRGVDRVAIARRAQRLELADAALRLRPATVAAATALLGPHEEQKGHAAGEQRGHERRVQPVQEEPAVRDAERELADHVRTRGVIGIDEVVVVALGDEAVALDRDDAVQDDDVQRLQW